MTRNEARSHAMPDDATPPIEARPHAGPPLMFFFKESIEPENRESLPGFIERKIDDGGPLVFDRCPADGVVILQMVDGRWEAAWPAPSPGPAPDEEDFDEAKKRRERGLGR
jgi:hypothetical protein